MIGETIPSYIRDYLLGARPPENCCVPEDSLPALVEGDLRQARVATVGINPHGGLSRDKYPPLEEGGAEMVWNDKQRYFQKRRYPYFGRLERVLKKCGVSYGGKYDLEDYYPNRLACSLDLVQWPTTPLWSKISKEAQAKLLKDGRPFVELVLERTPSIRLLLGNGRTVVRELEQAFSVQLESCGQIEGFPPVHRRRAGREVHRMELFPLSAWGDDPTNGGFRGTSRQVGGECLLPCVRRERYP